MGIEARSAEGDRPPGACSSAPSTLVVGLGNPLRGDDGVGARVVRELAAQPLPDDVEVVDGGTSGLGIVSQLEGRRKVIFVDAAAAGRAPGEFLRFTPAEVRLHGEDQPLSIHAAGLRDALLLAQALQVLPDDVVIFGVQPARIGWESRLSPEVEEALPGLIAAIQAEFEPGPAQA